MILLTGANGFIGRLLGEKYNKVGDEDKILSRNTQHKIEGANLCLGEMSVIEYLTEFV